MTGRKSGKVQKKKPAAQQAQQQPQQGQGGTTEETNSPPNNIKREQPAQPHTVKKIAKAENDEAKTLKVVFKSNPDIQMKEFIKKAVVKPVAQQANKVTLKTPADAHPPAVVQELLDTDDDVADNLAKLFKTSKSYKNL